jgi:hypothetical protein
MLGAEEQHRKALAFLIPSVIGSPATSGSASALKAVVRTVDADQLTRLGDILRYCESLAPSQPTVIEAMLERAAEHNQSTFAALRQLLLNSAVPSVDVSWGDNPPQKLAHLSAQALKYSAREGLSAATRDFYATIVS